MNLRHLLLPTLPVLFALLPFAGTLRAQNDVETMDRLRRDQDEVMRKAERLRDLMLRLADRYERENKPEQVKLLREGLAHLERSGVLRQVATIRDDLAATAFTEAVRKQKDVVQDLERLLNILLERKSIENLDRELAQAAEQAKSARELEQRQRELIDRTREAMRSPPSPAEQQLLDQLQGLRDAERREAERNARQAGSRRPALENALERVQSLLRDQQQLERGLTDEAEGRTGEAKAREFDLGDLVERTREFQGELRDQAKTQALRDTSRDLQRDAAGSDQTALQQSRDRLESQLQQPPKRRDGPDGKSKDPAWSEIKDQLRNAGNGASESERKQLQRIGEAGEKLAEQRDREASATNATTGEQLRGAAEKLTERMRAQAPRETDAAHDPAAAVDEAKQRLAQAAEAAKQNDTATAQAKVNEALAALDRARSLHQQQNPDAQKQAGKMASESHATSQDLQNATNPEQAEQDASKQLENAERALRDVDAGGDKEQPTAADRAERQQAAATARKNLEAAKQTLEQALQGASQNSQQEMQDAAARQQELQQAAAKANEQMQQANRDGALQKPQSDKAGEKMQQAKEHMQNAQQRLQSGQQSSASQEQKAAAESLQQAMDAIDQNRPTTEAQKQQLQQQAKEQQKLADDIVRLAQELKQRDNKNAERKVQQAADAAKKAQRAMEQGDPEEAQQQQEEARKDLEDAAKELEQEIDRYQDLRQEELLFRMKDELTTFLDRQRPISQATLEAQKSATSDGLSRAVRTKVNQLGEEEQELAGKLDALVQALQEEGNLVYQTVLKANVDDLREVARRLSGRRPDVAPFTTLLQQDVERRTVDLLAALERERQRREQERQQQQQQQQNQQDRGKNRFDPQRKKLVSLIAELEMLKKLGTDTRAATDNLKALVEARGEDVISEAEVALIERLAQRHNEITKLFQQIKAAVEETLQSMQGQEGGQGR